MNSLGELTQRAHTIRRQPMNDGTRADIARLREDAARIGVGTQLDVTLRTLVPDVFGKSPMPPVKVTNGGVVQNQGFGGNRNNPLMAFHTTKTGALPSTSPATAGYSLDVATKTTTQPSLALDKQFAPLGANEKAAAKKALTDELAGVRARGTKGSVLEKLQQFPGLGAQQKERVLDVLAEV